MRQNADEWKKEKKQKTNKQTMLYHSPKGLVMWQKFMLFWRQNFMLITINQYRNFVHEIFKILGVRTMNHLKNLFKKTTTNKSTTT